MQIFGHERVRAQLEQSLPPASLFIGPPSVGKWTTAEYFREKHGYDDADVFRVWKLTAQLAREARDFMDHSPVGSSRLSIIQLDGAARGVTDILLKQVEEANDRSRFIFVSVHPPALALASRLQRFQFGYLSEETITQVLVEKKRKDPQYATDAAHRAKGSVQVALELLNPQPDTLALKAVAAILTRNSEVLDKIAERWNENDTTLLSIWCHEYLTGRWHRFTSTDITVTRRDVPLKILLALRANIRPKLVVRSSLQTVLKGLK